MGLAKLVEKVSQHTRARGVGRERELKRGCNILPTLQGAKADREGLPAELEDLLQEALTRLIPEDVLQQLHCQRWSPGRKPLRRPSGLFVIRARNRAGWTAGGHLSGPRLKDHLVNSRFSPQGHELLPQRAVLFGHVPNGRTPPCARGSTLLLRRGDNCIASEEQLHEDADDHAGLLADGETLLDQARLAEMGRGLAPAQPEQIALTGGQRLPPHQHLGIGLPEDGGHDGQRIDPQAAHHMESKVSGLQVHHQPVPHGALRRLRWRLRCPRAGRSGVCAAAVPAAEYPSEAATGHGGAPLVTCRHEPERFTLVRRAARVQSHYLEAGGSGTAPCSCAQHLPIGAPSLGCVV
mmetsp:Transcript_99042/g.295889  ORF Transcript_99042/g.295889 Transcript_99042/m.295889 type:complete len:351 (-) Transcript_99042:262-1314(-)